MDAFVEDRSSRFFPGSHEPLMMKITSFAEREDWPNILVVVGGPGSGKSALLSKFYLDYTQAHERDLVIGHFVGASIGSADLRGTLRRICHEMGSVGDLPQDTGDLVTRFAELVNKATKSFRVVLIIDALNQMSESFNPQELNWLPANLPKRLRIIVSSTDEKAIEDLRHKRNVDVQSMDLLCREDKLVIIENFLGRYGKTMIDDQKETIVKKKESGYPLYLLVTLEELRTLGTRSEIVKSLLDFPGDAQSLFSWILKERLSNDPGFRDKDGSPAGERLVRDFLALLASSRYGLTQEELVDLIDPGDKLGNVAALQRFLRPYLMFRGDRLDFYHNQFRQAAKDSYLESEKVRKTYHKRLAEYFKDVPASRIDRLVEEYPYQLSKCQECDSLAGALSNLGLFVLAWEQGRKHEWMGYWKLLCSKYDPNIWYTIACQEEDRKGTITKNGWLYHVLGWFLMEMEIYRKGKAGNYSIAKAMFEKSLQIHENLLDPNHPSLAEVLNGIAVIYSTQGKWEEALKVLERVLSLRISGLGANHPKVAVTFNNIGISHYNLADWQKALHEYRSALKIYDMSNDVVLPGSADTHNNIGLICREKRRYKEALHNYEKALEIMDGVFDLYNPNKATVLSNMGDLYCDLENYEKAEHCYSRALDISEKPPYDRRAEEFQEKMENVRKRIKSR